VSNNEWGAFASWDEVCRRAAGRRHYNSWRQAVRQLRRLQVVRLLARYPLTRRGTVRGIARELGVSPATISRDIQALLTEYGRCPQCGQLPALGVGENGPGLADEILADRQAAFARGEWQWAGRGPARRGSGS
jgi:hypothetical protein